MNYIIFYNIYYMVKNKKVKTIKKTKISKLNIIFDIDDTLIHSYFNKNNDRNFSKGIYNNTEYELLKTTSGIPFIYFIRKYALFLLNYCFKHFNVGIWSNGSHKYVIPLLKNLLTKSQYNKLNIIITSTNLNDKYTEYKNYKNNKKFKIDVFNKTRPKPLEYLYENYKDFNNKNTLLIDDGSYNISVNPLNSIYLPMYCLNNDDNYLFNIYQWLSKHGKKKDIRKIPKNIFDYGNTINTNCFIDNKYYLSKDKLKIGDFVEYNNKNKYITGYITNINKNKYDIIEFNEIKLNDSDFNNYKNIDKSLIKKIII